MRAGVTGYSPETDAVYDEAIAALTEGGATLVDPVDFPADVMDEINAGNAEITVLLYEFKRDLNAYLATRTGIPVRTLAETIAFNEAHADRELLWFGQELFELAESDPFDAATYEAARARARELGGALGIDAALAEHDLDALVAPTGSPAWPIDLVNGDHFLGASSGPAAIAGYPIINVPAGDAFGLPVGLSIIGTAWSEPTLIKLASGFEAVARARKRPRFEPTLPFDAEGRPRKPHSHADASAESKQLPAAAHRMFGHL
jgi:amidase